MPRSSSAPQSNKASSSRSQHGPQAAVAFIPSGEAMAIFKAVELGAKGTKALSEWLASEGPLVVQVLESYPFGSEYRVHFRATNQTVHGMYLLGAKLQWPADIDPLHLHKIPERRFGWGSEEPPALLAVSLPAHLPTARPLEFCISIPLPSRSHLDSGLWHKRIGRMVLKFQVLDSTAEPEKLVTFAIVLART